MNDRPLTWFLVTALGLWGLWMWRRKQLPTAGPNPEPFGPVMPAANPAAGPGPTAYTLDSFGGMLR